MKRIKEPLPFRRGKVANLTIWGSSILRAMEEWHTSINPEQTQERENQEKLFPILDHSEKSPIYRFLQRVGKVCRKVWGRS
jgi:hypothetical protein